MDMRKTAETTLWGLKLPVLERLMRAAAPERQRRFAIACARLAVSVATLHWKQELRPMMLRTFEAAEALATGADPSAPGIVAARAEAEALVERFDQRQFELIGIIEDEVKGESNVVDHPLYPAYCEADTHAVAAEACAYTLHEDPLAAAALNLEILHRSIRIDYDTELLIARHWLLPQTEPLERDEVWPIFKRFPDEQAGTPTEH
jgi:hypothetical protein